MRNKLYFFLVLITAFILGFGCGSSGPTTPIQVPISVDGLDGQDDIDVDKAFSYTFEKPINLNTVDNNSFYLVEGTTCNPANAIVSTIECNAMVCSLTPEEELKTGTTYTICLTSDIQYQDGTSFEGEEATFETEGEPPEEDDDLVESLADIPDDLINPSQYDLSLSSYADTSIVKAADLTVLEGGEFSRIGCEIEEMKKTTIAQMTVPRLFLCYARMIESVAGTPFAGENEFAYWNADSLADYVSDDLVAMYEAEGVDPEFRFAAKKGENDYTVAMCLGSSKVSEVHIDTTDNRYNGHLISKWQDGSDVILEFDTDGPANNYTTATLSESYNGMSEGELEVWGTTTFEANPEYTTVYGYYGNLGYGIPYYGSGYARFNASGGTGAFKIDDGVFVKASSIDQLFEGCVSIRGEDYCGELEEWNDWWETCGWCLDCSGCFLEGDDCPTSMVDLGEVGGCNVTTDVKETGSFIISKMSPYSLMYEVAGTSEFAAYIDDVIMPDAIEEPTIEFTEFSEDVDCADSDSWTPVDFQVAPDLTDCDAILIEEGPNWNENSYGGSPPGCYQTSAAANRL